jgi:hypothetical protein
VVAQESPVIELVKVPIPAPSVVLVGSAVVGIAEVPQTTPRAVTAEPLSAAIVPPEEALIAVWLLIAVVETVAAPNRLVVNDTSAP